MTTTLARIAHGFTMVLGNHWGFIMCVAELSVIPCNNGRFAVINTDFANRHSRHHILSIGPGLLDTACL